MTPSSRLSRAFCRYHSLSHPETERTHSGFLTYLGVAIASPSWRSRWTQLSNVVVGLTCMHQAKVVACLLTGAPDRKPPKEVRRFGTKTRELMELRDWFFSAREK